MSDLFNEEIISQATHTKWAGKNRPFLPKRNRFYQFVDQASGEGRRTRGNSCTGRISVGRKRKTWQILGGTRGYVGYDEHSSQTEI